MEFRKDMGMLDDVLAKLIHRDVATRKEASLEELEKKEVGDDPSLLRFLADMRGEDMTSKVLRDDLMTMLIAGHETTAVSALGVSIFICLRRMQNRCVSKCLAPSVPHPLPSRDPRRQKPASSGHTHVDHVRPHEQRP